MATERDIEQIESAIHLIRGQRVMLDSELAKFYGVATKRLIEAIKRNASRFPIDFAFQLRREELTILRSQIATSSSTVPQRDASYGGRRTLPWVFTEHGAIMLAAVLNSAVAIDASVRVVRAFVRLRELILANVELATKFDALERRLDGNDEQIAQLFAAIRQLLAPPAPAERELGFHVREDEAEYGVTPKTRRALS